MENKLESITILKSIVSLGEMSGKEIGVLIFLVWVSLKNDQMRNNTLNFKDFLSIASEPMRAHTFEKKNMIFLK